PVRERAVDMEAQPVEPALAAEHLDLAAAVQRDPSAGPRRLAGADLGPGLVARQHPLDQDLDPAATVLLPVQAGRDHPGVVEDQQVAGLEQRRQVANHVVREWRGRRGDQQQAAGRALWKRRLRDQLRGEMVVEVGLSQDGRERKVALSRWARIVRGVSARTWWTAPARTWCAPRRAPRRCGR